jgi:1-acyl-sn-glycerol-3-phosphate acyltransferase
MSDTFYRVVRFIGRHPFWVSSAPVALGLENVPLSGPVIVAANHTSPFDIPLLMRHVPRLIDFVSVVEVFRKPLLGWFYGSLNAFPLDRSRTDAPTVRTILSRLERGRLVAMFPEGGFRRGETSVIRGGRIRPGVGRIATLANAPVVPAVIVNSAAYGRARAWLPIRGTRYGVNFGLCLDPQLGADEIERRMVQEYRRLYDELVPRLPEGCREL